MSPITLLILATIFTFAGIGLGIITGLIPGVHVNTISFLIVTSQGALIIFFIHILESHSPTIPQVLAIISTTVMGCVVSHTFLNFIPSTYLGAPEGETALSVLPAHKMVLEGNGYEAILASAWGSLGAAILALILVVPARLIMGPPVDLYTHLTSWIVVILLAVVTLLVLQEGRSLMEVRPKLAAIGIFFMAGFLGFILLAPTGLYAGHWFPFKQEGVSPATLMFFPLFTGLFGISNLLVSLMDNPVIPDQILDGVEVKLESKNQVRAVVSGTLSGGMVGWLPGITAAAATAVTKTFTSKKDPEEVQGREYIMAVSAVDTSCAIFTLVALFVIMRARSGAMQSILQINQDNIDGWVQLAQMPWLMALLLYSVILASAVAFILTLYFGKLLSGIHKKVEYATISKAIIIFLIIMIFIFSGPLGLFVGLIATCIGLIPPLYGIKRVHLMGCIIFPIILFLTGWDRILFVLMGL